MTDRADRFLARLDAQLEQEPDDTARRALIDRLLSGWYNRYFMFIQTEGESEYVADPSDPPHPNDYLETISGLQARRTALSVMEPA